MAGRRFLPARMEVLTARAPWYVAGPLIGILVTLLLWVANKPFGALGGYIEITELARLRRRPGWRTYFTLGIVAGGLFSAVLGAGWRPTLGYGSFDQLFGTSILVKGAILVVAGAFMGAGGRLAGGCTSGHGVCGMSFGSPASLVSTATFMATAIGAAHVIAWLFGSGV
jgi:uncharacterized membrane protein YedE/YeeE